MTINDTLTQRGSVYGEFGAQVKCISEIVNAMNNCAENNGVIVPYSTLAEWHYLAIKLARIASNPEYIESYRDLAGYTQLIMNERLKTDGSTDSRVIRMEVIDGKLIDIPVERERKND